MAGGSAEHAARCTADALALLPRDEWTVLPDVAWPGRRSGGADHVVIGPPGVFVIDSRDWAGEVTLADGRLRHNGHRRDSVVARAAAAAVTVKQLVVAVQDVPTYAVLCLTGEGQVTGRAGDTILCSTSTVGMMLVSRPRVLVPAIREDVVSQLEAKLRGAGGRPHAVADARRPTAQRQVATNLVSAVVGASLALGGLGLMVGQSQTFEQIGEDLVSFIGGDDSSPEERTPPGNRP